MNVGVMLSGLVLAMSAPAEHQALPDVRSLMESTPSLDPDDPHFEYALHGRRWRAQVGGQLGLWSARSRRLDFALAIAPFFELVNFGRSPVPWQSFRANVGFNTHWRPRLRPGSDLVVQLGWFHESDHVAVSSGYVEEFVTTPFGFDNGNFSTFEYFKVRADYRQSWSRLGAPRLGTIVSPGLRAFTPNLNRGDVRKEMIGMQGELRVRVRITAGVSWWAGGYGEIIYNRFDPRNDGFATGPQTPASRRPFITRRARTGITVQGQRQLQLVPQVGYENSNGRGVDFMRRWGHTFTAALAMYR